MPGTSPSVLGTDGASADDAMRDDDTPTSPDDEAPDDGMHGGLVADVLAGGTAVRFWGSVDLVVREEHAGGLDALRGTTPLTLDCRDVEFMDSTGLSILVRIVRDAAADGRDVRLLGASDQVQDLLVTTGVDVWMSGLGVRTD
jgi:anti-sigma B factor antagonist